MERLFIWIGWQNIVTKISLTFNFLLLLKSSRFWILFNCGLCLWAQSALQVFIAVEMRFQFDSSLTARVNFNLMILEIWSLIYTFECIFNGWFLCIFDGWFFGLARHADIGYWTHMLFWKRIFLFLRNLIQFFIFHWFIWFTALDFDKVFFFYW